jgi:hypothetical protein
MLNSKRLKLTKGAQSPIVSRNDPHRRSEPRGNIKQLMSPSPVVLLGTEADDFVFLNTMSCAALKKGVPGGLDGLIPSTVRKQQEAEVGPSKKKKDKVNESGTS